MLRKKKTIVAKLASASADDAAVEVTRLRQCLECKESELEIMQDWLSKDEQATKHLEAERQRADQLASQLSKSSDEVGQLLERAVASEAALDTLEKQLKAVSQENEALGSLKEEMQQVSVRSESLAARVSILESTLQKRETELTRSHSELDVVKKENQELLAGGREATEMRTKAEKTAEGFAEVQAELKEKESEVDRLEAQLQQKETKIAELQTRIQPQVAAPVATGPSELHGKEYPTFTRVEERSSIDVCQIIETTSTQKDWVASFKKQATQYLQQLSNTKPSGSSPDVEAQLAKEQQAQSKLQAEVAHYKVVLADTEAILQQLQNSVEQEEKKWSGKVSQSDSRDDGETTRDGSTSREVEVVETPVNGDPPDAAIPTRLSPRVEPRETRPRRATRMPKKYEDFVT